MSRFPRAAAAGATPSNFWLAYEGTFSQRIHRFCGKEEDLILRRF